MEDRDLPPPSPLSPLPVPGAKKRKGQPVNFSDGLPPLLAKARENIYVSQPLTSLSLCLTLRAYSHCVHIVSLSHTACILSHCVHIVSLALRAYCLCVSHCVHIVSVSRTVCILSHCVHIVSLVLRAYCLSVSHCVHIVSQELVSTAAPVIHRQSPRDTLATV